MPSNNGLSPGKADVVAATHAVEDRVAFGTSIIVGAGGGILALASPLVEDMLVATIDAERAAR